jgi:hypothetical protein
MKSSYFRDISEQETYYQSIKYIPSKVILSLFKIFILATPDLPEMSNSDVTHSHFPTAGLEMVISHRNANDISFSR